MANDSTRMPDPTGMDGGAPRDRRATHRAAIEIPAVLLMGTREVGCSIRNLSSQGIALALRESVGPGMVVRVVFRLPNSRQPVEVSGVLVRSDGGRQDNTVGLQFIEPGADAIRVIATFVERNRSDLPFSSPGAADSRAVEVDTSESGDPLDDLYKQAVSEVGDKTGTRRGLFDRWRHRGKP